MTTTTTSGTERRRFVTFYVPRVRLLVAIGRIFYASTPSGIRRMPGLGAQHFSLSLGEFGLHIVRFTWTR